MENDDACQMVGIGTIYIKMFDGVVKDLTDMTCFSDEEEHYLSWSCGVKGTQSDIEEWYSEDHEGVHGCDEGCQRHELVLLKG